jgi:hypothetical protein
MEGNIAYFEADPRFLRISREGGTDSVSTGYRLVHQIIHHNERVLPVVHKRAQVHVILRFVGQFFLIETENVVDDVYFK